MHTKQLQHHGPRAPQGKPEKTVRIALRCTPAQRRKMMRNGGSMWIRQLIDQA